MDITPISQDQAPPPSTLVIEHPESTPVSFGTAPERARLTVVEQVAHYAVGSHQPMVVDARYTKFLDSSEDAYRRRLTIGDQWQHIDCGWVTDCEMLCITNSEGTNFAVIPSPEERAEVDKRIIEVRIGEGLVFTEIPPGESARLRPVNLSFYEIRSQYQKAKITLTLIPR